MGDEMLSLDLWLRGGHGLWLCVVLVATPLSGCGTSHSSFVRPQDAAKGSEAIAEFNLGVISGDISHEVVIGGQSFKHVEDVVKSCGCTSVGVAKGDLLDLSLPFLVRVNVAGKVQGPQSQSFRIAFTDGTAYSGKLSFDYWPLPHVEPMYLVFRAGENEKDVRLLFPREAAMAVVSVDAPSYLSCQVVSSLESGREEWALRFQIDRTALQTSQDGVVTIHTTSPRRDAVKIPYLVLLN